MKTIIAAILIALATPAAAIPVSFTMERGTETYTGSLDQLCFVGPCEWRASNNGFWIDLWDGLALAEGNIFGTEYLRTDTAGNYTVFDTTANFQGLAVIFAFEPDGTYTATDGSAGIYYFGQAFPINAPPSALWLGLVALMFMKNPRRIVSA